MLEYQNYKNFLGSNFDFLSGDIKNTIQSNGMTEALTQMLNVGQKQIGRGRRRALADARVASAQSGFGGVDPNAINNIFESEAMASGELTANIGRQADVNRTQAVSQLMGLDQTESGLKVNTAQMNEQQRQYEKTFQENVRQFGLEHALKERQMAEQEAGGGFFGGLGKLAGGAFGILSGGILGGAGDWLGGKAGGWLDSLFT